MERSNIKINQRIPLHTLEVALTSYLTGNYDNDYIIQQLRLEFSGDNRLKKGLKIVNKIIQRNPINQYVIDNQNEILTALKKKADRDVILISLVNAVFPFSFDVLHTFGKFFSAQDMINTDLIMKSISNKYGGNRATENGLYSVIPMFLEANFFSRPKNGIYEWQKPIFLTTTISRKIFEESFKINKKVEQIYEQQFSDPYFLFISNR